MKYIDADKLYEKVDALMARYEKLEKQTENDDVDLSIFYQGKMKMCSEVLNIIASFQQERTEVDLEKELEKWRHDHFKGKRDGDYSGEYLERESQLDIARHFVEWGAIHLSSRKEE